MSHRLQILIPEDLHARLEKAAQRAGVSKGQWVREAVERYLADRRGESDPVQRLASLDAPTGDIADLLKEIEVGRRT